MGLELGSGGKEEHTQERLVPEHTTRCMYVCSLVESTREGQLSRVSQGRKEVASATVPSQPPKSYNVLGPENPSMFLAMSTGVFTWPICIKDPLLGQIMFYGKPQDPEET